MEFLGPAVPDKNWKLLREHLLTSYGELVKALTRRLRSRERAEEALQDTYEKLQRGTVEIAVLQSPQGYLLRMATRIAMDRWRSENGYVRPNAAERAAGQQTAGGARQPKFISVSEGDNLIHHIDETPDPERIVAGRSEMKRLAAILDELPARRREIFIAAWVEEQSHHEIAQKFGLSLRSVQHELKLARQHCLSRVKRQE